MEFYFFRNSREIDLLRPWAFTNVGNLDRSGARIPQRRDCKVDLLLSYMTNNLHPLSDENFFVKTNSAPIARLPCDFAANA